MASLLMRGALSIAGILGAEGNLYEHNKVIRYTLYQVIYGPEYV